MLAADSFKLISGILSYHRVHNRIYIIPVPKTMRLSCAGKLRFAITSSSEHAVNELLDEEQEITQKLLKRVLEEVKANGNSKSSTRKPIMPKIPFKEENYFKDFEAKIEKSENKFNDLVADFLSIICGNSPKFLKEAWRKMMTDEVAQKFCWQGTNNKTPVRALSVTPALKPACNQKFATAASDSEFERTVISFFQHANNRLQKKHAYK